MKNINQDFIQIVGKAIVIFDVTNKARLYVPINDHKRVTKKLESRAMSAVQRFYDNRGIIAELRYGWKCKDVSIRWCQTTSSYKEEGASGSLDTNKLYVINIDIE